MSRTCPICSEVYPDDAKVCGHDGASLDPRLLGGRYRLVRQLGEGAFGEVHEAEDTRLHKRVAVKLLSLKRPSSSEELERFRREAIAASMIGHEAIVNVTDIDRDPDGTSFIVMELLRGRDIASTLADEGPMSPPRAFAVAAQIAFALEAAHRAGIVHRDLKPANVYLVETQTRADVVKIIDFGISKVLTASPQDQALTATGAMMGTPYYMSPEQARGEREIDGRTDVYALGVILFQLLTGRPVFVGENHLAVIAQHLTDTPPAPSSFRAELSAWPEIDAIVLRALEKESGDRFPTMHAFGDVLLKALDQIDAPVARAVRPIRLRSEPGLQTAPRSTSAGVATPAMASTLGGSVGQLTALSPAGARSSRRAIGVVAAVGLLGAGAIAMLMLGGGTARHATTADAAPVAANEVEPPSIEVAPDAAIEVAPRRVVVSAKAKGAEALGPDGARLGALPYTIDVPPGQRVELTVRARGYVNARVTVDDRSPVELVVPMKRRPRSSGDGDKDIADSW